MKKVMLVEDEDFILQGLENIIDWEALGLSIIHKAHNGAEALEMLAQEKADIIVTDVSMPLMNGLEMLEEVRRTDPVTRFIILTGYNEFEYARAAIRMDVEEYILKPIDEEELVRALVSCMHKLKRLEEQKNSQVDERVELLQFLDGARDKEGRKRFLAERKFPLSAEKIYAAIMKVELSSLAGYKLTDVIRYIREKETDGTMLVRHLRDNNILLICVQNPGGGGEPSEEQFVNLQNELEIDLGVRCFLTVSACFTDMTGLPEVYRNLFKMQKYLLIDGYGSCVTESHIGNRSNADVSINREKFVQLIVKKDTEAACAYMEDLFINNMQEENSVEVLYQIAVRIALIFQEIRTEYNLAREGRQLSDIIDDIYRAENFSTIRTLFLSEIVEIISGLNTENTQYTPVVRQIMAEVNHNYKNDMNLKTLAYKYHMNTSYLGQIFQKEIGCPFSQYLNNVRNGVAKNLILTTNMRINDIAKEVGYADTSYFYRKFKQSYGVSPAAMREMKKY